MFCGVASRQDRGRKRRASPRKSRRKANDDPRKMASLHGNQFTPRLNSAINFCNEFANAAGSFPPRPKLSTPMKISRFLYLFAMTAVGATHADGPELKAVQRPMSDCMPLRSFPFRGLPTGWPSATAFGSQTIRRTIFRSWIQDQPGRRSDLRSQRIPVRDWRSRSAASGCRL